MESPYDMKLPISHYCITLAVSATVFEISTFKYRKLLISRPF